MKALAYVFVLLTQLCCCLSYTISGGSVARSSFIGCLYADVCLPEEECHNDNLFGTCKLADDFTHKYNLEPPIIDLLKTELKNLLTDGYSWSDPYTQCILRSSLIAYRLNSPVDLSICGAELISQSEKEKRDELVERHKYFIQEPSTEEANEGSSSEKRRAEDPVKEDLLWSQIYPDTESVDSDRETDLAEERAEEKEEAMEEERDKEIVDSAIRKELEREEASEYAAEEEEREEEQEAEEMERLKEEVRLDQAMQRIQDQLVMQQGVRPVNDLSDDSDYSSGPSEESEASPTEELESEAKRRKEIIRMLKKTMDKKDSEKYPTTKHGSHELANPRVLYKNSGHAKSISTVRSEDPEVALKQLSLTKRAGVEVIDKSWFWVRLHQKNLTDMQAKHFVESLAARVGSTIPFTSFELSNAGQDISFHVPPASKVYADVIYRAIKNDSNIVKGFTIDDFGFGKKTHTTKDALFPTPSRFLLTAVICGSVLAIVVIMGIIFFHRRGRSVRDKLYEITKSDPGSAGETSESYKELCRQRMQSKNSERPDASRIAGLNKDINTSAGSARSSTSSWSEEPVQTNMDISTGHIILSYMEEHLNDKDKLEAEWKTMCAYEPDVTSSDHALKEANRTKNRFVDVLPYDQNRVTLRKPSNSGGNYINASLVVDHDPKSPAYILTQGPLENTVADFWQMVWEQGCSVIVCLTSLVEEGIPMCHKYWPEEGSDLYSNYEVHLVSEHVWCEDYLVRSFYLKNVETGETRTVTQFHFLNWHDLTVPVSPKSILDFRRKVNKSFRGRQSPVIVHCSDGCGRAGTYTLLDMVLNRTAKGVKEIDIAATLEHLRDQRCDVVKSKEQFEFVLTAIAEEVHAMLKALPQ